MKKKIVSVLLASLMVTSMLAGCGNSSGSSSSSGAGSTGGDTTSASGTEAGDTGLTAEEQEEINLQEQRYIMEYENVSLLWESSEF